MSEHPRLTSAEYTALPRWRQMLASNLAAAWQGHAYARAQLGHRAEFELDQGIAEWFRTPWYQKLVTWPTQLWRYDELDRLRRQRARDYDKGALDGTIPD